MAAGPWGSHVSAPRPADARVPHPWEGRGSTRRGRRLICIPGGRHAAAARDCTTSLPTPAQGVTLTAIIDACHAGNLLRLPYRASVQQGRPEWNDVEGAQASTAAPAPGALGA